MLQEMLQKLMRHKIIFAVLNILLGIVLIFAGRSALNLVIRIVGYALIAAAVAYLAAYIMGKNRDQVQLYYAAISGAAGLGVLWLGPKLINLFPALAGIVLIFVGITNLTSASRAGAYPAYSKVGPIVTIVLGALALFQPGAVVSLATTVVGAALILNGLSELDLIRRIW